MLEILPLRTYRLTRADGSYLDFQTFSYVPLARNEIEVRTKNAERINLFQLLLSESSWVGIAEIKPENADL
ncbi:MAG TPA: hypothetical protein VFO76_13800 [Candidatus Kapabacteria bacterium]|nr:hypothetical protein [Candidatus Kapabacteria bacterium]